MEVFFAKSKSKILFLIFKAKSIAQNGWKKDTNLLFSLLIL